MATTNKRPQSLVEQAHQLAMLELEHRPEQLLDRSRKQAYTYDIEGMLKELCKRVDPADWQRNNVR